MGEESHSTAREGVVAGCIGAAVVALWYFVIDVAAGRPMHTPNAIAVLLFGSGSTDAGNLGTLAIVTIVHFSTYIIVGCAVAALVHLAAKHIAWRMGVLLALVIAAGFFAGLGYALGPATGQTFPHWTVIGGGLLAVASMGLYFWRTHPALVRSFADVPLGDETDSVPHAREMRGER